MKAVVLNAEGYRTLSPGQTVDVVRVGDASVVVRASDGRNAVLFLESVRLVARAPAEPQETPE